MHTIKHMPISPDIAKQVFGGQATALDRKINESTALYGGEDINKKVEGLNTEQVGYAQEVYTRHYLYLRKKYEANPNSLTEAELVAAQLYQNLEANGKLTPNEQAKLYTILGTLEGNMKADPNLMSEMGLKNADDQVEYSHTLWQLKGELFYNLTGYDPSYSKPERSQFASRAEYKVAMNQYKAERQIYIDRLVEQRLSGATFAVGIRRTWNQMRYGGKSGRNIFADSGLRQQELKDVHWQRIYEGLEDSAGVIQPGMEGKIASFKPEVEMLATINAGFEKSRQGICVVIEGSSLTRAEKDVLKAEITAATDETEIETAVTNFENALSRPVGSFFASGGRLENLHPNKMAAESVTEKFYAADMDRIAREALQREMPKEKEELLDLKEKYQKEISSKEKLRIKKVSEGKAAEALALKREIEELQRKLRALELLLTTEKGKGVSKLLNKDYELDDLDKEIPAEYRDGLAAYLAQEYEVGTAPGAATYRDDIKNAMKAKKPTRFNLAKVFMSFLGTKVE